MIDGRSQHFLSEITEKVYNIYKDRLFVKVKDPMRERAMEIVNNKKIDEKTRRFVMAGFLGEDEKMEINKEVEYEMNKHLDFEIDKAFRDEAYRVAKAIVGRLKDVIPKEMFEIKIQASIGAKIIASERISAMRKNVTAKLYGGDVTRKRKLLEKQKKGKKRMMVGGRVRIPQDAYLSVLKRD